MHESMKDSSLQLGSSKHLQHIVGEDVTDDFLTSVLSAGEGGVDVDEKVVRTVFPLLSPFPWVLSGPRTTVNFCFFFLRPPDDDDVLLALRPVVRVGVLIVVDANGVPMPPPSPMP